MAPDPEPNQSWTRSSRGGKGLLQEFQVALSRVQRQQREEGTTGLLSSDPAQERQMALAAARAAGPPGRPSLSWTLPYPQLDSEQREQVKQWLRGELASLPDNRARGSQDPALDDPLTRLEQALLDGIRAKEVRPLFIRLGIQGLGWEDLVTKLIRTAETWTGAPEAGREPPTETDALRSSSSGPSETIGVTDAPVRRPVDERRRRELRG